MRLFLAIDLPEPIRKHLDRVRDELSANISWVKRENWHVTLKFLGEVADPDLPKLLSALDDLAVESMNLFADRMVYFPKRGPVHVVGIGISGDVDRLNQLHAHLEDACHSIGFPREAREFTAHITLGRSRKGEMNLRPQTLDDLFPGPEFRAERFVLMQSRLSSEGSEYTPLAHFPKLSQH